MRIRTVVTGMVALALSAAGPVKLGAEDAKASEVLTAARKAIGGQKLETLKTLSVDAALIRNTGSMQLTADVEILLDLPDKFLRSEVSSGMIGGSMSSGFVGTRPIRPANSISTAGGGMIIRMGGPGGPLPPAEKLSPEDQERADQQFLRATRADISRLMLGWFASAHPSLNVQYSYVGEAESPDGKADVIDARNDDGFSARVFIDRETHLPLMVTYKGPQPRVMTFGGSGPAGERRSGGTTTREEAERHIQDTLKQPPPMVDVSLYFDDWREVDGIRFPHNLRRATGGTTGEEWTINKVRVNPKVDAKKFEG